MFWLVRLVVCRCCSYIVSVGVSLVVCGVVDGGGRMILWLLFVFMSCFVVWCG